MTAPGPLGWISPADRTKKQHEAHERAMARIPRFAVPTTTVPKGTKVILTDLWKRPEVVADVGFEFTGFHQLTGSCVGVSAGNWLFTIAAMQRCLATAPLRAFVPWWPYFYGRTRYNEGDRGEGEGAIDSVMAETLLKEGCFSITEVQGLPAFDRSDGLTLTSRVELDWSDGVNPAAQYLSVGKTHLLKAVTPVGDTNGMRDSILNGYGILDGCNNYVGHGSIKGSGDTAYVTGHYDGRGGHSTCFLGYWEHPNDGPLFLYSNQWPSSTYPKDPAGGGRCCVWLTEAEAAKLFRTGGDQGETLAGSPLDYFPAQPLVIDWLA